MPEIEFNETKFTVPQNANLRSALVKNGSSPYNGKSRYLNCKGLGTCGTCAVEIEGKVSEITPIEKWRLDFPPHSSVNDLRLACQVKVIGDLKVTKHEGFWGHKIINSVNRMK